MPVIAAASSRFLPAQLPNAGICSNDARPIYHHKRGSIDAHGDHTRVNGNAGVVLPRWYPEPSWFATISSLAGRWPPGLPAPPKPPEQTVETWSKKGVLNGNRQFIESGFP